MNSKHSNFNSSIRIEKGLISDADALSQITIQSKSYWNYSKEQIEAWTNDLTISETYIEQKEVYKFIWEDKIVGYYSYYSNDSSEIKLDNLFILPDYIGKGFGKLLMVDLFRRISNHNFNRLVLDADPNAANFYLKFGFQVIGSLKTSIPGRELPVMALKKKDISLYLANHTHK